MFNSTVSNRHCFTIGVVLLLALFYYRRCFTIGVVLLLALFYYQCCFPIGVVLLLACVEGRVCFYSISMVLWLSKIELSAPFLTMDLILIFN